MDSKFDSTELRDLLFSEAERINNRGFIVADPVQFPRRFTELKDIEITALLVSTISWGNRKMICRNAERLLQLMEYSPYQWCMDGAFETLDDDRNIHRTFFGRNLKYYLRGLRLLYSGYSSLDAFASAQKVAETEAPAFSLGVHLNNLLITANEGITDSRCLPQNLKYSALKRFNMALRWLVRDDGIVDLGVWKSIKPSQLFIPLDVHSAATSRELGLIKRKQTDRKALMELMKSVIPFNPEDPALFDFALFGIGMGL